jgi:membrane protein DedA with SNARE-associated domain
MYSAVYAALGFAFRNQLEQLVAFLRKMGTVSVPVVGVVAAAYVVYSFRKHRSKTKAVPCH